MLEAPEVEKLSIRVIVDSSFDLFFRPNKVNGVAIQPPARATDFRRSLHNEWGLSLWLESQRASEERSMLLDYGYSQNVLFNNIGLLGFLDQYRAVLRPGIRLYAGGEDNFCHRFNGAPGQLSDFGMLDRRELAARNITAVLADKPTIVANHAFTTGQIRRRSIERVLPNTHVEFGMKDGAGCDASQYLPAEMNGKTVPDEHIHEHATCFNVKGKGLVVISSCGHAGIVNSVRQAQEVSGVEKVHAIVGGFHLGPAPKDYLTQVVAEIKKLNPDVLIPMHCSGLNFVQEARSQMPENVLVTTTGSRITFGA